MSHTRADNGKRIIAVILDFILAAIIFIPFYVILGLIPVVGILFKLLGIVIYLGYIGLRDALPINDLQGASLGKKIMGIKAIQANGANCTYELSFKRNLPFVTPAGVSMIFGLIPAIGWIIAPIVSLLGFVVVCVELYKVMTDAQGKRIGDLLADTTVVDAPKAAVTAPAIPSAPSPASDLPPLPTPPTPTDAP